MMFPSLLKPGFAVVLWGFFLLLGIYFRFGSSGRRLRFVQSRKSQACVPGHCGVGALFWRLVLFRHFWRLSRGLLLVSLQ